MSVFEISIQQTDYRECQLDNKSLRIQCLQNSLVKQETHINQDSEYRLGSLCRQALSKQST